MGQMAYCLYSALSTFTQCIAVKALILIKTKCGVCLCSLTYCVAINMPPIQPCSSVVVSIPYSCCDNQPPLIMEGDLFSIYWTIVRTGPEMCYYGKQPCLSSKAEHIQPLPLLWCPIKQLWLRKSPP